MKGVNNSNVVGGFSPVIAISEGDHFWRSSAITVGKVALGISAFSAVLATTGRLMQMGSIKLIPEAASKLRLSLKFTGTSLFLVGKSAFLSIAVPTYIMAWILPKWLVTQGIPKAVNIVRQYVIVPISQGVIRAVRFFGEEFLKMVQAIYNYVLKPLGKIVAGVFTWTWNSVVIPISNGIAQVCSFVDAVVVRVAQAVYNYVLKPLGKIVTGVFTWTWNSVVIPISNGIAQVCSFVDAVVVRIAQAIYNYVLKPLGQFMRAAFGFAYVHVFIAVSNATRGAMNSVYEAYARLRG